MTDTEQMLFEKIKQLPPQRMARLAAKASEPRFVAVWGNDQEAAQDAARGRWGCDGVSGESTLQWRSKRDRLLDLLFALQ